MLEKFPGNESFRIDIASPFAICCMFNSSVIVMMKLLKALATFVRSFNFSSFSSNVRNCSTECIFPVSFFVMLHVVFILVLDLF